LIHSFAAASFLDQNLLQKISAKIKSDLKYFLFTLF
jgi:hypothetical protein